MSKKWNKSAAQTTKTSKALIKVIVKASDSGDWIKPATGEKFYINEKAEFPDIEFEFKTEKEGPYIWEWIITWNAAMRVREKYKRGKVLQTFTEKGTVTNNNKKWIADLNGKTIGGILVVKVKIKEEVIKRTIVVLGKQPSKAAIANNINEAVESYTAKSEISSDELVSTMKRIVTHESGDRNFIVDDGEPIVSFDKGYGLTQITNPSPTFEQIWCWKENIKEGIKRFRGHLINAKKMFLKYPKTTYTLEMLQTEAISRWNGGVYYVLEGNSWVRNPKIICIDDQGNTSYKLTEQEFKDGKTKEQLRQGGKSFSYTGVCYADNLQ
jgi:hypothetical protein